MTQYTAAVPFNGDADKALTLAGAALTAAGFRLTERTTVVLEATGPDRPGMHHSRQLPLAGVSRIGLRSGGGELAAEADLGGADGMARFVSLFPPLMLAGVAAVLCVVFAVVFGPGLWILAVAGAAGGNAVLWLILGPLLGRSIRGRTRRAVDALLASAAVAGRAG